MWSKDTNKGAPGDDKTLQSFRRDKKTSDGKDVVCALTGLSNSIGKSTSIAQVTRRDSSKATNKPHTKAL